MTTETLENPYYQLTEKQEDHQYLILYSNKTCYTVPKQNNFLINYSRKVGYKIKLNSMLCSKLRLLIITALSGLGIRYRISVSTSNAQISFWTTAHC